MYIFKFAFSIGDYVELFQCMVLSTAVSELFVSIRKHILETKQTNPTNSIINEWENVLSQNVNLDIFAVWYNLAGKQIP